MDRKNKIKGCMVAGAIGDALGYQIEFRRNIKERQVTKYKNDFGIISDDTQMALFTANALIAQRTRSLLNVGLVGIEEAIYFSYLDWYECQTGKKNNYPIAWLKEVPVMSELRAPGNTCLNSLGSGVMGTIRSNHNKSKGCGSVMRIAPCACIFDEPYGSGMVAAQAGAITHGNPVSSVSCFVMGAMINILINTDKTIREAFDEAIKLCKESFKEVDKQYFNEFMHLVERMNVILDAGVSDLSGIKELGEGWVADEAFVIAVYSCLKHPDSIEDAIICAVNHDGDSDSTGAIAGNIIGAHLGFDAIDKYYIDNLEAKEIIIEVAEDLCRNINIDDIGNDTDWKEKYLFGIKNDSGSKRMRIKDIGKIFRCF